MMGFKFLKTTQDGWCTNIITLSKAHVKPLLEKEGIAIK
jgi:hypothetical protein